MYACPRVHRSRKAERDLSGLEPSVGAGRRCGEETEAARQGEDSRQRRRGPTRPDFLLSACRAGRTPGSVLAASLEVLSGGPSQARGPRRPGALSSALVRGPWEGKHLPGGHGCVSLAIGPFPLLLEGGQNQFPSQSWMEATEASARPACRSCAL